MADQRCNWATSEALAQYHDTEWGVPSRDDSHLFELLTLEGAQAGLSWSTILNKRAGYRRAFANFDIDKVARLSPQKIDALVQDESIVRHRGKNGVPCALYAQTEAGRSRRALREFLPLCVGQHDARAGAATVDADQIEVLIHRCAH